MKRPIEPSEIRKGDLIRWEAGDNLPYPGYAAVEITADRDGMGMSNVGQHYLLDRPAPPVQLPSGSHFGTLSWVDGASGGTLTAEWLIDGKQAEALNFGAILREHVTAFTPATAIPTEALDELREAEERAMDVKPFDADRKNGIRRDAIFTFLAAVDAAGDQS